MPPLLLGIFSILGLLISTLGFLVFGFGPGKFAFDAYEKAPWQVQIALVLGFFEMLVGIASLTTPGSTGMFVLGAGAALILPGREPEEEEKE